MHICIKPPKINQEERPEAEEAQEKEDYLNCVIENITHELLERLNVLCQILCCVPLDKIFPNAKKPYYVTEHNVPCHKYHREYNGNRNRNGMGNGNGNGNGMGNGNGNGNDFGNGNEFGNGNGNGTWTRHWDDNHTPRSKIRIMEKSKPNNPIDNRSPSLTKSLRHRFFSVKDNKELEMIDRSIETRSSSIELYSRIDKIRVLKDLQVTSDIEKLIGAKNEEKNVKEYKSKSIDTRDLPQKTTTPGDLHSVAVSTTDEPTDSMATDNLAGDGPQIKLHVKPTRKGIFKRLFMSQKQSVKNNKNVENVAGCEEDCGNKDEACIDCKANGGELTTDKN